MDRRVRTRYNPNTLRVTAIVLRFIENLRVRVREIAEFPSRNFDPAPLRAQRLFIRHEMRKIRDGSGNLLGGHYPGEKNPPEYGGDTPAHYIREEWVAPMFPSITKRRLF